MLACIDRFTTFAGVRFSVVPARRGDSFTPLMLAVQSNCDISIFDKLVSLGAVVDGLDTNGFNTLHLAVMTANEMWTALRQQRRSRDRRRAYSNALTILRAVAITWRDEGKNFNEAEYETEWTAAHFAAAGGCLEALQVLVENSGGQCVDRSVTTLLGETAFEIALDRQNAEIYHYIEQYCPQGL